jgi:hypothetical protein
METDLNSNANLIYILLTYRKIDGWQQIGNGILRMLKIWIERVVNNSKKLMTRHYAQWTCV